MIPVLLPDAMSLRIARKDECARDIFLIELRHPEGFELPPLATPNGSVRKNSLYNAPAERHAHAIAVRREGDGRGGSIDLIDHAQLSTSLMIAPPCNDFELSQRANDFLFIAGGIGIAPIMAVLQSAHEQREITLAHQIGLAT